MPTPNHRRFPALAVAALLALLAAPTRAQEPGSQRPANPNGTEGAAPQPSQPIVLGADEGPLVVPGDPPDIILEFTSKVAGYIEPCG